MFTPVVVTTADGSDTVYIPEIDEHYHSVHGAISESEIVFLRNGFLFFSDTGKINVLEIGFGTGLNCLLTALEAQRKGICTIYFAIEKYPLNTETVSRLNYPEITGKEGAVIFRKIHACPWNVKVAITPWFELHKIREDFITGSLKDVPDCQVVYFDAFSPGKQPEMWNMGLLRKLVDRMAQRAVLVTYCARGVVRRNLAGIGLQMERLPGPEGKREILRGLKADDRFK